jgi:hypothetical protein
VLVVVGAADNAVVGNIPGGNANVVFGRTVEVWFPVYVGQT